MKTIKIIILLAFASLLMSSGCSTDDEPVLCDCVETQYTLPPGANAYQYFSTILRPDLDCDDEKLNISYNGFYHTKIECE